MVIRVIDSLKKNNIISLLIFRKCFSTDTLLTFSKINVNVGKTENVKNVIN